MSSDVGLEELATVCAMPHDVGAEWKEFAVRTEVDADTHASFYAIVSPQLQALYDQVNLFLSTTTNPKQWKSASNVTYEVRLVGSRLVFQLYLHLTTLDGFAAWQARSALRRAS